jgi:CBS domain containing-hemolysin-like protein
MGSDLGLMLLAVALIAIAGLFAAMEAAISRLSRSRVEELSRENRRGVDKLRRIMEDTPRYLNLVLLLRVACEVTACAVVAVIAATRLDRWAAVGVAAAVMVVVSYVVVGVSPRTVGRQHAGGVGLIAAALLPPLAAFFGPVPKLLILLGNAVTPGKGFREGPFASEAELRDLVDLAAEESRVIEDGERRMVHSVFELADTIVREVMVPRTDMVFIERDKTLRQALSLALRSGFSRIPVVGEDKDDIVGVIYLKDLVRRTHDHRAAENNELVESVMRPATFVPDSKPVDELLKEMQLTQSHIAILVDEYGGTAGLVTMEDLVEEIVGEIADEYDRERPVIEPLADGSSRVSARLGVEELGELFGKEITDEDVDTVGGLLAKHLGRVPIPGSEVVVEGLRLYAESTGGRRNRISTVLVTVEPEPADETEPAEHEHA